MSSNDVTSFPNEGSTVGMDAASGVSITVLIVIDTEYVKAHYPNPSTKPESPTTIDDKCEFMICTGSRGIIKGQGTPDLNFKANPGDFLSFSGQSIYGNSDDAVIVYGITNWSGDDVFNRFHADQIRRTGAAVPNPDTLNGLPARHLPIDFMSLNTTVKKQGHANFNISFGIYTLDENSETQQLHGYYRWDPEITVQ